MVNIYHWDAGSRDGQWLSPEQFARLGQESRAGKDVWGVDREASDEAEGGSCSNSSCSTR